MNEANGRENPKPVKCEELLKQVAQALPLPMFVLDEQHRVVFWNVPCERITGIPAHVMLGRIGAWSAFYSNARPVMADLVLTGCQPEDLERYYPGNHRCSQLLEGGWESEDFFPQLPGGGKWLEFTAMPLRDDDGRIVGAVETFRDLTPQKGAEEAAREGAVLLSEIIQGCPVPMFVIDAQHRVTHWNRACESIVGVPAEQMIGSRQHWWPFYSEPRPVMADLVLDAAIGEAVKFYAGKFQPSTSIAGAWEAKDHFPQFPGGGRWLYFTAAPLHGADGRVIGAVETLQDISEQKRYEAQLESQARQDMLTGLANRTVLDERLRLALAQAARDERLIALAFVDLDRFKPINDELGHAAGDTLLRELAKRLTTMVRDVDTVARVGGDEFVVLLSAPDSLEAVEGVVRRIIKTVGQPIEVDGRSVQVGCSIGIALYPRHGTDQDSLLHHADAAMYLAKAAGRNGYRIHSNGTS
jgi:diguanylate cyclase (GGDEF)-like protein